MPKPPAIDPPVKVSLWVPASDKAWLDLHLWSDLDQRVPYGAHREWFLDRLREFREWGTLDLTPLGFPPGFHVRGPQGVLEALEQHLKGISK